MVNDSPLFVNEVGKYSRMLKEVMDVTMSLQTDGHSLVDCRDDLDMPIEAVRDEKRMPFSPFYNSRLGTKHIAADSSFVAYPEFENAVIKLQRGLAKDLTNFENELWLSCVREVLKIS